jgi:Tol biopolymer transport system component
MSGSSRCSAIANRFRWYKTEFLEDSGVFSPDGRWIAYTTNESGQPNIFVQPFPGAGEKHQVSRDEGSRPVWRADGKELFYLGADAIMMAVPIDATGQFYAGVPHGGARLVVAARAAVLSPRHD